MLWWFVLGSGMGCKSKVLLRHLYLSTQCSHSVRRLTLSSSRPLLHGHPPRRGLPWVTHDRAALALSSNPPSLLYSCLPPDTIFWVCVCLLLEPKF